MKTVTIFVMLIFFLIYFAPKAIGYWNYYYASELFFSALPSDLIHCADLPSEIKLDSNLAGKINTLTTSVNKFTPGFPSNLRLRARLNCATGNFQEAVNNYNQIFISKKQNLLDSIELGFAYIGLQDQQGSDDIEYCELAAENFSFAGINSTRLIKEAEDAIKFGELEKTKRYVRILSCLNPRLLDENANMSLIHQIVQIESGNITDIPFVHFEIPADSSQIKIEGEQFIRLSDISALGDQIYLQQIEDTIAGVLFSNGAAGIFLNVESSGMYQIEFRTLLSVPPPVEFQIEHNLNPLSTFQMNDGNNNWGNYSISTYLDKGWHLIGIRFLNDANIEGVDRNLYFDWVKIIPDV